LFLARSFHSLEYFRVYANDLNPNSYDWLKHNFELNKVPKDQYTCFNKDGKDFIKEVTTDGFFNRKTH
jgi:tRNA (guanine37-N1)-methyltransferase